MRSVAQRWWSARRTSATFRGAFFTTLGLDIGSKAVGAVTVVVAIRALPVSDYAFFALFLSISQLFGSGAAAGFRVYYLRTEVEAISRGGVGRPSFRTSFLASAAVIVSLTTLGFAGGVAFGLADYSTRTLLLLFALSASFGIAQSLVEMLIAHEQAHRRFWSGGLLAMARNLALLVLTLVVIALPSGYLLAVLYAAGILLLSLAGGWELLLRPAPKTRSLLGFGSESGWLTVYFFAFSIFTYVDLFIVGLRLPEKDVAAFGAAQRYMMVVLGAVPALLAILRVRTSQADLIDSLEKQRAFVLGWLRRATVPGVAVLAGIGLVAGVVIETLDGGRYPESIPVVRLLLPLALASYLTAPATNMLMAQSRYRTLALLVSAGAVANIVGDLIVIGPFGLSGVAAVSTAIFVAMALIQAGLFLRHSRPRVGSGAVRARGNAAEDGTHP